MIVGHAAVADRPTQRFRLGREVSLVEHDGSARLVDMRRGLFYALDPIGTRLLNSALEGSIDEEVDAVARDHGVGPEQVRGDWATLLYDLRLRGLVVVPAEPWRRRLPGRLRLGWLLAQAWLSIRVLGWAATVRHWQRGRLPSNATVSRQHIGAVVDAVSLAVQEAAAGHWLNTECKERALVGWYVLRHLFGLPAEMVIGIIPFPFQAHAWVECSGQVVTDDPAGCELYTPVARYS